MRVLWLSVTPSLYDEGKIGGWIASLESIVQSKHVADIKLGIVFETDKVTEFRVRKNGTTYYPFINKHSALYKIRTRTSVWKRWDDIRPKILKAIDDFKPDIIHCFGSEWPYGAIVNDVDIPVVIHMQGFLNIYNMSQEMAVSKYDQFKDAIFNPLKLYRLATTRKNERSKVDFERKLMVANHYFMGRTEWDKNICKYFSPGSKYYHVSEAIRPDIYDAVKLWHDTGGSLRLITITQAGYLKGNEIILRAAKILKEDLGLNFEWRVAGNKSLFRIFEKKTGIKAANVNVNLIGMIDSSQIVEELSSALFYIHPAIIDNSPNSLCEAQLVGCPVIASNVGGIPQLVEDGKTGFLYPYNEPYALAFIIRNLMEERERLSEISKQEIVFAKKRHDPDAIFKDVVETYADIITDYKGRGKVQEGD